MRVNSKLSASGMQGTGTVARNDNRSGRDTPRSPGNSSTDNNDTLKHKAITKLNYIVITVLKPPTFNVDDFRQ